MPDQTTTRRTTAAALVAPYLAAGYRRGELHPIDAEVLAGPQWCDGCGADVLFRATAYRHYRAPGLYPRCDGYAIVLECPRCGHASEM